MSKHTDHTKPDQTCTCYACGRERYVTATRPFGFLADGTVATRVCLTCADAVTIEKPRPIPSDVAALAWTTLARADRLVTLGEARTTDHALRQGLALLERQALEVTA